MFDYYVHLIKILIVSTTYKQEKTLSKSDFSLLEDLGKK